MSRSNCLKSALVAGILLAVAGPAYGHVRLIVPNGGEELEVGTVFTIEWTILIQHNQLNWDLWYSTTSSTGPWTQIVMNLPPGSFNVGSVHTYDWTIPDDPDDSVWVRVRMDNAGTDYYDVSNGGFRIQEPLLGDLNCDDVFNGADIDPFFLALGDPSQYSLVFPNCDPMLADMNSDGLLNGADIGAFFNALGGG